MTKEPVGIGAAVVALVNSVLQALVLFGVDWTAEQLAVINLIAVNLVVLVTAWVSRNKVTPVDG